MKPAKIINKNYYIETKESRTCYLDAQNYLTAWSSILPEKPVVSSDS
jgi:hypothetical protein